MEERVSRIAKQHSLNEASAKALIKKTDKKRAAYYNFYTGKSWGVPENYDLCVETARFGIDKAAERLAAAAKLM